jgi:hypothetical protein
MPNISQASRSNQFAPGQTSWIDGACGSSAGNSSFMRASWLFVVECRWTTTWNPRPFGVKSTPVRKSK